MQGFLGKIAKQAGKTARQIPGAAVLTGVGIGIQQGVQHGLDSEDDDAGLANLQTIAERTAGDFGSAFQSIFSTLSNNRKKITSNLESLDDNDGDIKRIDQVKSC